MKRNKLSKLGLNLKDDVRKDKDYFLKHRLFIFVPPYNISNGNHSDKLVLTETTE